MCQMIGLSSTLTLTRMCGRGNNTWLCYMRRTTLTFVLSLQKRARKLFGYLFLPYFLNPKLSSVQTKRAAKILYVFGIRWYVRIERHELQFSRIHVGNHRRHIVPCGSAPRFLQNILSFFRNAIVHEQFCSVGCGAFAATPTGARLTRIGSDVLTHSTAWPLAFITSM